MSDLVKTNSLPAFDYSAVKPDIAQYLKQKELIIEGVFHKARFEVGKELKEAQEHLSKNGYGCFGQWCESMGFSREMSSRLIRYNELIVNNVDKRELIEAMPVSLIDAVAKPSAPQELKEAVLNGNITTHKEYQELKKKLEEEIKAKTDAETRVDNLAKQLEDSEEENQELRQANKDLSKRPLTTSEIQEKYDKVVSDFNDYRTKAGNMVNELNQKNKEMEEKIKIQPLIRDVEKIVEKEIEVAPKDYYQLKDEVEKLQTQLKEIESNERHRIEQAKLDAKKIDNEFMCLNVTIMNFLKDVSPYVYLVDSLKAAEPDKQKDINISLNMLEKWVCHMREEEPHQNNSINEFDNLQGLKM